MSNNSFNLHNNLYDWNHFANEKNWDRLGGIAKVTEFTSDGTRNQTQAVSFWKLSSEPQSSSQTKVKATIPIGSRKPNLYPQISRSNMSIRKQMRALFINSVQKVKETRICSAHGWDTHQGCLWVAGLEGTTSLASLICFKA